MSVWESAPAFSIGGKTKDSPRQKIPGPGSYDPKDPTETSPQWKMGSSSKGITYKSDTPGPGAYEAKLFATNDLKYTIRPRIEEIDHKKAQIPGPGAYDSTNTSVKYTNAPSYSLGGRDSVEKVNSIPGPGQYELDASKVYRSAPAYSLRARVEAQNRSLEIPGPGAYSDKPDVLYKYASQNTKFGTESRDTFKPKKDIPPPGAYEIRSSFETGKGYSILARTGQGAIGAGNNLPGPGAYQPNESIVVKSTPSWKLGSRPKDNTLDRVKNLPGPGAYEPNLKNLRGAPGFKMDGSDRLNDKTKLINPGPGSYEIKPLVTTEGLKYSLRGRADQKLRNHNPGPGAYSPDIHVVNKKDPSYKLGKEGRDTFKVDKEKPGPGQYDLKSSLLGPSYGFGREARDKHNTKAGPSPGMYDIPSTIGHIPAYAMKQGKLKGTY